ncbi:zinc ribbon domain-containing protein [Halobaculum sp. MBLA0143]|uniref:zinc ribbon domain-containing protein n=1 Tax=Halobaculum sp. MBLA0143 TaxID=3079933 RepID=UPI0035265325
MSETPRYCSACGERLSSGDNYCPACGDPVTATDSERARTGASGGGRRDPGAATTDDRHWLSQRVADLRARGWKVTYDDGDRVELVDRGVGSIPVHLVLFFVSSGLANLLYAWYSYTWGAPKRIVTADGNEEVDDDSSLGTALAVVAGVVLLGINGLLFAISLLVGVPQIAVSVLLFTVMAVAGTVAFRSDIDTESPSTFGRERRVETESVETPPESCAACDDRVVRGERREFSDKFYLAGVPVRTHEEGSNTYCADCVADNRGPDDASDLERELRQLRTDSRGRERPERN